MLTSCPSFSVTRKITFGMGILFLDNMVLSWMIYFSSLKHVRLLGGKKNRWTIRSCQQILSGAPWIACHSCIVHHHVCSPTNWLPSVVCLSSTLKSYPKPHELPVIHASSTIESGVPRIDCLKGERITNAKTRIANQRLERKKKKYKKLKVKR